MNASRFALLALASSLCGSTGLTAQNARPRFHLPEQAFDYETVRTPPGRAHQRLRDWNERTTAPVDPRVFAGCCFRTRVAITSRRARSFANHGATLGRVLFYDKLLSRNRTTSCASCHVQAKGFADGRAKSRGFQGKRTKRNSMGIANLTFRRAGGLFWDERVRGLAAMVLHPIQDSIEMGLDLPTLVKRVAADAEYAPLFANAFGTREVTEARIGNALAQFVHSMVSLRSKFDRGIAKAGRIDKQFANFTSSENRGRRLFFGLDGDDKGRQRSCASCHNQRDHFNPSQTGGFSRNPMIFQSEFATNNGLDRGGRRDDPGVGKVTKNANQVGNFRVPSLRNIEVTGPYMHDGRLKTLKQVLEFYSNRVRPNPNLDVRLTTNKPRFHGYHGGPAATKPGALKGPFGYAFTSRDRRDIVAFLKTLTDHEFLSDERFSDPFKTPRPRARRAASQLHSAHRRTPGTRRRIANVK